MARRSILLALIVLLALNAFPKGIGHAQQQAAAKSLQYEVSVVLKLIRVYVMDKKGKPVPDLAVSDFVVTDNGKPVTISAFEKHELAAAPGGVEPPAPKADEASSPAPAPILSRKFILLFDFCFNTAPGIVASVEAARHFLDNEAQPNDQFAVISYATLKGIRIHEYLTSDHSKIKAALAALTSKDIAGRADEVEQTYWMMVNLDVDAVAKINIEAQRRDSALQAQEYFSALTRLAKALRLVQGEKNILFFSNGVPYSLINSVRRGGTDSMNGVSANSLQSHGTTFDVGNSELMPLQETMLKEFTASSCSIYSFDTRESSKLPALFAYDEIAFLNRPRGGLLGADTGGIFRDDKTTGMDSLRRISKQTGGKYYSNIALHEKNLEEVSTATGAYYVLGYSVPAVTDGAFHGVKVEVARKGCIVRTQPGYYDPKPFSEYTDLEKNIHLFDLALNERSEFQIPKSLPISTLSYDLGPGTKVRAIVQIPKEIWQQFAGRTVEIVALFFDSQDSLLSLQRIAVPLEEYRNRDVLFTAATSVRPGPTRCRLVVRDLTTGQSAVAATTAYSGPPNRLALSVFSPLLVVGGSGLFVLEGVVKGAVETTPWRAIYDYDASASRPIIGEEPVRRSKVEVILPYSAPGLDVADMSFKANLVNSSTGKNLAIPFELRESSTHESVQVQKLVLSLENIPNGLFLLYIHVGHGATGQVSSARVPIFVEQ